MFNRSLIILLGTGLLGGCSLAPRYERPAPPVATAYPTPESGKGTAAADVLKQKGMERP